LVTKRGVIGVIGVNGMYALYGVGGIPVLGVFPVIGPRINASCLGCRIVVLTKPGD
jgi:hypothetical protein